MDHQRCRASGDLGEYFHGWARARVEPQERVSGLDAHAIEEVGHGMLFANVYVFTVSLFGNLILL